MSDFEVCLTEIGNQIELLVDDEDLIDETFVLAVNYGDKVICDLNITIKSAF